MATTAHVFPNFTQAMGTHSINLSSDTLKVGVASGTFNWVAATQAYTTVSQFLTNSGSGGGGALTEVSYSGATPSSRISLAGVSFTDTGLVSTLTATSPSWTSATWTANYVFFYDYTAGGSSDSAGLLICYWDLGGSQIVSGQTFTLTISGSGLVTWTSS
jgi:hypothetical protein